MEILDFLNSGEEPMDDSVLGPGYRCSVRLKDGLFLPCVIIRKPGPAVDSAIKTLERAKEGKFSFAGEDPLKTALRTLVLMGNRVDEGDVVSVEKSHFAIPLALLDQIKGETVMSLTAFALEFKDGRCFGFATRFNHAFFDLPEEYSFKDAVKVHNHSFVNTSGDLRPINGIKTIKSDEFRESTVFMDKPFFECYQNYLL